MEPIVSIIIPAYNVAPYIGKCLSSLFAQTYQNFEVIVMDDGSTDATRRIVEEYKVRYQHLAYFYQDNGGVSVARAQGRQYARGQYILFIDGDDVVHGGMLAAMMEKMTSQQLDIVICGYYLTNEQGSLQGMESLPGIKDTEIITGQDGIRRILMDEKNGFLWNKLYRSSICTPALLQSVCGMTLCEDLMLNFHFFLQAQRIGVINQPLYYYVQHATSVYHSTQNNLKHAQDVLQVYEFFTITFFLEKQFSENIAFQAHLLLLAFMKLCTASGPENTEKNLKQEKKVLKDKITQGIHKIKWSSILGNPYLSFNNQVKMIVWKLHLQGVLAAIYMKRR